MKKKFYLDRWSCVFLCSVMGDWINTILWSNQDPFIFEILFGLRNFYGSKMSSCYFIMLSSSVHFYVLIESPPLFHTPWKFYVESFPKVYRSPLFSLRELQGPQGILTQRNRGLFLGRRLSFNKTRLKFFNFVSKFFSVFSSPVKQMDRVCLPT